MPAFVYDIPRETLALIFIATAIGGMLLERQHHFAFEPFVGRSQKLWADESARPPT